MVSGIVKVFHAVVFGVILVHAACASTDPVKDYLEMFSPLGGGPRFFSDDVLLRLELDIDGDGVNEVLLSIARDRNGKEGNAWLVYKAKNGVFKKIGGMTFNDGGVFVGMVEELHRHGVVKFWPSGGGEGTILAYTLENGEIRESSIGALEHNQDTGGFLGQARFDRYFGPKQRANSRAAQEINASEFGAKYGVRVEPISLVDYLGLPAAEQHVMSERSARNETSTEEPVQKESSVHEEGGNAAFLEPESSDFARKPAVGFTRDLAMGVGLFGVLSVLHLAVRARKARGGK
jgi:hypothetical protein